MSPFLDYYNRKILEQRSFSKRLQTKWQRNFTSERTERVADLLNRSTKCFLIVNAFDRCQPRTNSLKDYGILNVGWISCFPLYRLPYLEWCSWAVDLWKLLVSFSINVVAHVHILYHRASVLLYVTGECQRFPFSEDPLLSVWDSRGKMRASSLMCTWAWYDLCSSFLNLECSILKSLMLTSNVLVAIWMLN